MPIVLPFPMTPPEIRVLQEFRRLGTETMALSAIQAIRHPTGGGDTPAHSLASKGYLTADDSRQNFTLTEKAKEFLSIDARPAGEEEASTEETVGE